MKRFFLQKKVEKYCHWHYNDTMKNVGVNELSNHLNEYLGLVKNGEVIFVTDNSEIVAEIRKVEGIETKDDVDKQTIEACLDKLSREKKLRRAKRSLSRIDSIIPKRKVSTAYNWKHIYQEVREDRY